MSIMAYVCDIKYVTTNGVCFTFSGTTLSKINLWITDEFVQFFNVAAVINVKKNEMLNM